MIDGDWQWVDTLLFGCQCRSVLVVVDLTDRRADRVEMRPRNPPRSVAERARPRSDLLIRAGGEYNAAAAAAWARPELWFPPRAGQMLTEQIGDGTKLHNRPVDHVTGAGECGRIRRRRMPRLAAGPRAGTRPGWGQDGARMGPGYQRRRRRRRRRRCAGDGWSVRKFPT